MSAMTCMPAACCSLGLVPRIPFVYMSRFQLRLPLGGLHCCNMMGSWHQAELGKFNACVCYMGCRVVCRY